MSRRRTAGGGALLIALVQLARFLGGTLRLTHAGAIVPAAGPGSGTTELASPDAILAVVSSAGSASGAFLVSEDTANGARTIHSLVQGEVGVFASPDSVLGTASESPLALLPDKERGKWFGRALNAWNTLAGSDGTGGHGPPAPTTGDAVGGLGDGPTPANRVFVQLLTEPSCAAAGVRRLRLGPMTLVTVCVAGIPQFDRLPSGTLISASTLAAMTRSSRTTGGVGFHQYTADLPGIGGAGKVTLIVGEEEATLLQRALPPSQEGKTGAEGAGAAGPFRRTESLAGLAAVAAAATAVPAVIVVTWRGRRPGALPTPATPAPTAPPASAAATTPPTAVPAPPLTPPVGPAPPPAPPVVPTPPTPVAAALRPPPAPAPPSRSALPSRSVPVKPPPDASGGPWRTGALALLIAAVAAAVAAAAGAGAGGLERPRRRRGRGGRGHQRPRGGSTDSVDTGLS